MKFNKKIILGMCFLIGETQIHSTNQRYNFVSGEVSVENVFLPQSQNPRYVDRSLLLTDMQLVAIKNQIKMQFPHLDENHVAVTVSMAYAQSILYGMSLPILRFGEYYQYPSYQTFSRLITDPMIMFITATIALYIYFDMQISHKKNHKTKEKETNTETSENVNL